MTTKLERAFVQGLSEGREAERKSIEAKKLTTSQVVTVIVTARTNDQSLGIIEAISNIQNVLASMQSNDRIVRYQVSSTEVIQGA